MGGTRKKSKKKTKTADLLGIGIDGAEDSSDVDSEQLRKERKRAKKVRKQAKKMKKLKQQALAITDSSESEDDAEKGLVSRSPGQSPRSPTSDGNSTLVSRNSPDVARLAPKMREDSDFTDSEDEGRPASKRSSPRHHHSSANDKDKAKDKDKDKEEKTPTVGLSVAVALGLLLWGLLNRDFVMGMVAAAVPKSHPAGLPTAQDFQDPGFNPFLQGGVRRYQAPQSCDEAYPQYYPWDGHDSKYNQCPAIINVGGDHHEAKYNVAQLSLCQSTRKVPGKMFINALEETGRLQFVNFTGPISKKAVSAMVLLPEKQYQNEPRPVLFALHARDQGFEDLDAKGNAVDAELFLLMMGFNGWAKDTICELNDPKMEPHILVVPLRGGDRMWMDCHDKSACHLETQITQELVPYIDKKFNTLAASHNAKGITRACLGYSMGASGCLQMAIKHPDIFQSVLVQSPGVWPRFVEWDQLISRDGPMTSGFSTRSFLMEKVFNGKEDYDSRNTCNLLRAKLGQGNIEKIRPKMRIWFGQQDPYIDQDLDLFNCLACNQMCFRYHNVRECQHGGFFTCLTQTDQYPLYMAELYTVFDSDPE